MKKQQASKKPSDAKRKRGMVYDIIEHAEKHNMVINPVGYDYYVDGFITFNHCPCDSTRPKCPCEESVEEVKEKGHCKCHLFWRDLNTFKETKFKGGR